MDFALARIFDLIVEESGLVDLGSALERVLDPELVERVPQQGPHVLAVGLVAAEGVGYPRHRVGDVVLERVGEPGGDLPQPVEVVRVGDELGLVARGSPAPA